MGNPAGGVLRPRSAAGRAVIAAAVRLLRRVTAGRSARLPTSVSRTAVP
jgi:hypothetical protein